MYSSIRMVRNSADVEEGMRSHSFCLTVYPTVRIGVESSSIRFKILTINFYSDFRDPSEYRSVC